MRTAYRPLSDVREELRVTWYRCPIAPAKLRAVMQRSDAQGWFPASGYPALFAATGVLTFVARSQQLWLLFVLLPWAHGTVGSFLLRMNWHIEHHLFAGVPCYNHKKLYREVAADMPQPRSLSGAWREMGEVWRRQQTDADYQLFDTPLPATAWEVREDTPDKLESSIGELAPRALA